MDFHVCIKQVPDVAASVDTGRMVLNAYDASAVEECLVLREKYGGQIRLVLVGPESAGETIRKALAMGADEATHIVVPDLSALDSEATARILAAHFRDVSFDVIACGKQAQDTDAGLTGSMLAELLSVPYATNAVGLDIDDGVVVTRQADGGREIVHLPTPCLVTCSNDMNDPRIASLKGIMAAKRKTITTTSPSGDVPNSLTRVVGFESPPPRKPGQIIDGDPAEAAAALATRLRDEAKVL
jgi:electron transfer flavoprotein beta subunit